MIYSVEPILKIQHEIYPLFEAAWAEVDQLAEHVPLDPDWEKAGQLEEMGMWRTYTSRTDDGELIGFICVVIQSLLHSKNNYHATTDVAFVKPEHRGRFKTLLDLAQEDLKEQGVKWFSFTLKSWDNRGDFLDIMGFKLHENVYQKVL